METIPTVFLIQNRQRAVADLRRVPGVLAAAADLQQAPGLDRQAGLLADLPGDGVLVPLALDRVPGRESPLPVRRPQPVAEQQHLPVAVVVHQVTELP
jgi:hypothetical protein